MTQQTIINLEHIRKLLSKEFNDNIPRKDSTIIQKHYFHNIGLMLELIRSSIDMINDPEHYKKIVKLCNPDIHNSNDCKEEKIR